MFLAASQFAIPAPGAYPEINDKDVAQAFRTLQDL
jgi:hypothetical protein